MTVECLLALVLQMLGEPVAGKKVLEVGAQDVNGSIRPFIEALSPSEYVGIDMAAGKGVDVVVDAGDLIKQFGPDSFDFVLSSAAIEHIYDWKAAIHNMKGVCRCGGTILVITCAPGYPYHGYPSDFWRYALGDLKEIFSDCELVSLETVAGNLVMIKVRKPVSFREKGLEQYELYSVVTAGKVRSLRDADLRSWRFRKLVMRTRIMAALNRVVGFIGSRLI